MGFIKRLLQKTYSGNMLRVVCIAGLILSTAISVPLLIASITYSRESPGKKLTAPAAAAPFSSGKSLGEYDREAAASWNYLHIKKLDALLNAIEKNAISIDSHVSVLKRRRAMAMAFPEYRLQYQAAVSRIQEQFPHSEILSIIAGESLLISKNQLDNNDRQDLLRYAGNISSGNPIALLGFHLFGGSGRKLPAARTIPQGSGLFVSVIDAVDKKERPLLVMDGLILRLLSGNNDGARNTAHAYKDFLLEDPLSAWFLVELLYDFDNPRASAAVLGVQEYPFVNSQSIIRLADTLYRMNAIADARFFWDILTRPGEETVPGKILEGALYNLAGTSPDYAGRKKYLEQLLALSPDHANGLILYSRLLDYRDALNFLQRILEQYKNPLADLELVRRSRGYAEAAKVTADTWLLLGRHPGDRRIYEWASFYFEEMRLPGESAQLARTAGYNHIEGPWLSFQEALDAMKAGDLEQAENLLKGIAPEEAGWQVPANLGLIAESRQSMKTALDYYESAASLVRDNRDLAKLQIRIAQCLRALGKPEEADRVLDYAMDLDPENLTIRMEMRRSAEIRGGNPSGK